jgi:hypothetical protein
VADEISGAERGVRILKNCFGIFVILAVVAIVLLPLVRPWGKMPSDEKGRICSWVR